MSESADTLVVVIFQGLCSCGTSSCLSISLPFPSSNSSSHRRESQRVKNKMKEGGIKKQWGRHVAVEMGELQK